jgi:hypothetical protein
MARKAKWKMNKETELKMKTPRILNFATTEPPAVMDARAKFRNALEAKIPEDMKAAGQRVAAARDARGAASDAVNAAKLAADEDNPRRSGPTAAEKQAAEALLVADADLREARQALRIARERFAGEIRNIALQEAKTLAPGLIKAAGELEQAIELLGEVDQFCLSQGIDAIGYSMLAVQLSGLREFARQLKVSK